MNIEKTSSNELLSEQADSYINWGAGRAFALGMLPPEHLKGVFTANEAYMFYRIGAIYNCKTDQKMLSTFIACLGSGLARLMIGDMSATVRAPICAGLTFAFGKATKAYFESKMTLNDDEIRVKFAEGEQEAKRRTWNAIDE